MFTEKGFTLGLYISHGSLDVRETYKKDREECIKPRVRGKNQNQGRTGAGTHRNQNISRDLPLGKNQGLGTNGFFKLEERT